MEAKIGGDDTSSSFEGSVLAVMGRCPIIFCEHRRLLQVVVKESERYLLWFVSEAKERIRSERSRHLDYLPLPFLWIRGAAYWQFGDCIALESVRQNRVEK